MPTPVFNLISTKKEGFQGLFVVTAKKSAKSDKSYFVLQPKQIQKCEIYVETREFVLTDCHVTVYETLRAKQEHVNSSYHVTLTFQSGDVILIGHTYYDNRNKLLLTIINNKKGEVVNLENTNDITQVSKLYANQFFYLLCDINRNCNKKYVDNYEAKHAELIELSRSLPADTLSVKDIFILQEYVKKLNAILQIFVAWHEYEIDPDIKLVRYFERLREVFTNKLTQLTTQPVTSTVSITPTTSATTGAEEEKVPVAEMVHFSPVLTRQARDKIALSEINRELTALSGEKIFLDEERIIKEYHLLDRKISYIFEDEELLKCLLKIRELEKRALSALTKMLMTGKGGSHLESLVKIIPRLTAGILLVALNNDRADALEVILKHHPYINLDAPVSEAKVNLLVKAYERKNIAAFRVLLQRGTFCDRINPSTGYTLLSDACVEKREEEMIALLQAGASNSIKDKHGSLAFGCLSMFDRKLLPDIGLMRLFRQHCRSFYIDAYQGKDMGRTTPLIFACQNGWFEAVKFYIVECRANPIICRTADYCNSLTVCTVKGHDQILQFILDHTTFAIPVTELNQAYLASTLFKTEKCKNIIELYAQQHQMTLNPSDISRTTGSDRSTAESFFAGFVSPPTGLLRPDLAPYAYSPPAGAITTSSAASTNNPALSTTGSDVLTQPEIRQNLEDQHSLQP